MSDKKINSPGQSGFIPPGAAGIGLRNNSSPLMGVCRVHINSMFRLAETPLSLQSYNPSKIPLQSRANTRTQKSQIAAENASQSQRQQASSGAQASAATGNADLDELDNEEAGSKKSAATDGTSGGGMTAAKKPTSFSVKTVDQAAIQGGMYRATANLREQQEQLEQAFARSKLPGVELLTKAPGPDVTRTSLLPTLALGLLTAANLPSKAGAMPSRVAATMMMTRAFIQAVPPQEQVRVSMEEIKTCVIAAAAKNPPPAPRAGTPDEALENSLVLLPLAILHACRKRTQQEQPLAASRIGMMISSRAVG
jgi:hypothetical protein